MNTENTRKNFIIAIDGPASSGKSTTAKRLADRLNWVYIDSGAMYRAIAIQLLEEKVNLDNRKKLKHILANVSIDIITQHCHENIILLNKKDITKKIRTPEISNYSTIVARDKNIRKKMVELQRNIARSQSVIMDGRDIGTVVFPDADFKFFLTASIEARAKRRWLELNQKNNKKISLEKVKKDIKWRDESDKKRKIAPLKQATDAVVIDTTLLTITQQVDKIFDYVKSKIN